MPRSRKPQLLAAAGATALASVALAPAAPAVGSQTDTGSGTVFITNPVQSTGDQSLVDGKDAAAVPEEAYFTVPLTDLDGSGYLRGTWANVRSETGPAAYSATGEFHYDRSDDRFEQVMAYFWTTEAQHYLRGLGFGTGELRAVNAESQDVRINQWGLDNSYSWDKHDLIRLGKGGVDDAEDGEVIVHEYGHAVHDSQVPGFGTSVEAGSIGEGFGDYLAVTVGLHAAEAYGAPVKADPACVADWDAVSYTNAPHCLRRVDRDLTYDDRRGRVHYDGQIWSRALWDIRGALGPEMADRILIEAQFDFAPDTSMSAAAKATIATAERLYGKGAAHKVRDAFADRGIPGV